MILEIETKYKIGQRIYYIDYSNGIEIKSFVINHIISYAGRNNEYFLYYGAENGFLLLEDDAFFSEMDAKEHFRQDIRGGVL